MIFRLLFLPALCFSLHAAAAVQPADGAAISHTQVMFEFDEQPGADTYVLTLNQGGGAFSQTIRVQSLACMVSRGLRFGNMYSWYYTAYNGKKQLFKSPVYSFSISSSPLVDDCLFRYNLIRYQPGLFQDNLIFIDNLGVAINRRGQPVWFLPWDSAQYRKIPQYRNMQLTPGGTITYLRGTQCFEKDRQGNVLWQGPDDGAVSGDATEHYHHDFEKMPDGTYMVCSYRYENLPCAYDSSAACRLRWNTVIQYNNEGRVLWKWDESEHLSKEAMFRMAGPGTMDIAGTHMNGFSFAEQGDTAVFCFRNNNQLLWVHRQTGKVLYRLQGGSGGIRFTGQHSPQLLPGGRLLVYNNNFDSESKSNDGTSEKNNPAILLLGSPKNGGAPAKLWEYECRMDEYPGGWSGKEGYAGMLPNGNILICVGGASKMREVTSTKKVVWEMNCAMLSSEDGSWIPFSNYRSHFASSLYPYYFTVQHITGGKPLLAGQQLRLKINNDGTEADRYRVQLFSGGTFQAYDAMVTLKPGAAVQVPVPLKKSSAAAINQSGKVYVTVRITPQGNPAGFKNIELLVKE